MQELPPQMRTRIRTAQSWAGGSAGVMLSIEVQIPYLRGESPEALVLLSLSDRCLCFLTLVATVQISRVSPESFSSSSEFPTQHREVLETEKD